MACGDDGRSPRGAHRHTTLPTTLPNTTPTTFPITTPTVLTVILCTYYYSTYYYRAYQVRTEARWRAQATRAMMVTRMGYWHKLRARKLQRIISRLHEIMWLLQPEGSAVLSMAEGDAKLTLAEDLSLIHI